jgi:hypothetical protein
MRLLPDFNLRTPVAAVLLPSDRFFLRLVPLAPDLPALSQAELALEAFAPFPPSQLFWGCCVAPDRTSALVYAAHRRRFSPEEQAGWEHADLVAPDLLVLVGSAPAAATLLVQAGPHSLAGVAWNAGAGWPVAVHARGFAAEPTEDNRRQFAAELAARAGLPGVPVRTVAGVPAARREGDRLIIELADAAGANLARTAIPWAEQDTLDVRDRSSLGKRRRDRGRGEFIWRLLLAGGAAAALALLLEVGGLTFSLLTRAQRTRVERQAPGVEKLATAHSLASRIDELTHRRLRFFEMLATINDPRPRSIAFTRTGTNGRKGLEIEASTNNADDVGTYESALRSLPALEKVEIKDLRARDGVTTFALAVEFKPESGAGNGGAP